MDSLAEFDLKSQNSETIRDISVRIMDKKYTSESTSDSMSRSIFFLGSKGSGKTSIINQFLDRDEGKNECLVLDYTFGRKSGMAHLVDKNICHVWELQGDVSQASSKIITIPLSAHNIHNLNVFLTLDLSQANSLWITIENAVDKLHALATRYNTQPEFDIELRDNKGKKINKTDSNSIPIFIIGGRYDIFKDLEPSYKKLVCKVLRCVALYLGAGLLFYAYKDQALVKKIKDVVSNIGFGIGKQMKSSSVHDVNRPLFIVPGSDSWESIGTTQCSWESIKQMYCIQHPQVLLNTDIPDDPSLDSAYKDVFIDSLRSQKDEQLKLFPDNK